MIRYLTAEEILVIHALVVDETGGSHGVREPHLLVSIAHRPQMSVSKREIHGGIYTKAAALAEAIVNYHVFIDGNKRTAFVATARFLAVNGYRFTATNKEVEKTMIAIATKEITPKALAMWIKKNTETE